MGNLPGCSAEFLFRVLVWVIVRVIEAIDQWTQVQRKLKVDSTSVDPLARQPEDAFVPAPSTSSAVV